MSFLNDTLAANKVLYQQVCDKISSIVTGAQEHSLNDGQIDQRVKNADLEQLREMKSMLENEIAEAEGDVCNTVYLY